jgi:hypothetical protein
MPDAPADTTEVFKALCWSRAYRWREGVFDPGEDDDFIAFAVDPLWRWAVDHGLVDEIGADAVQRLMSEAFQ